MIEIGFEGWFQCRLATDPDPYDHLRGQMGWTFAFAGEPNLDRVIRLQDPVAPRSHAPAVGVAVTGISRDGVAVANSPLEGAEVRLLGDAVYEGRNGDIAVSAREPIAPFDLEIRKGDFQLRRDDPLDLDDLVQIIRRQPINAIFNDPELMNATGIPDPVAFREGRLSQLRHDLQGEQDASVREQLKGRIRELEDSQPFPSSVQFRTLMLRLVYRHELSGTAVVDDPSQHLPELVTDEPWSVEYWMGGWDADTLCGFVRGKLGIPVVSN